jgi:integrase
VAGRIVSFVDPPPKRPHGFRHSFATRALANGKTDDWVRQRTGHTSPELLTYRESARPLEELELGEVAAIPGSRRSIGTVSRTRQTTTATSGVGQKWAKP